jgi:hypothetical protein
MFKMVTPALLHEEFGFDGSAMAPRTVTPPHDIVPCETLSRDPSPPRLVLRARGIHPGLLAARHMDGQSMRSPILLPTVVNIVLFLPDTRETLCRQHNEIVPMILPAERHHGAVGGQTVQD